MYYVKYKCNNRRLLFCGSSGIPNILIVPVFREGAIYILLYSSVPSVCFPTAYFLCVVVYSPFYGLDLGSLHRFAVFMFIYHLDIARRSPILSVTFWIKGECSLSVPFSPNSFRSWIFVTFLRKEIDFPFLSLLYNVL